jgi:hypothetical protein
VTYNTDRRKPLTKKQRPVFLAEHNHLCYWCGEPIVNDEWDDEHILAKELMPPGSDWNSPHNRAPIHRKPCHKEKTAKDIKLIAKSNRIRRANGPEELRRKTRHPIKGRKEIPSRPFPKRIK